MNPPRNPKLFIQAFILLVLTSGAALAGEPAPPDAPAAMSLWSLIAAGGIVGYFIILLSLVAVALVAEHFLSVRRKTLVPDELAEHLDELLNAEDYSAAQSVCAENGSFLAVIVGAGLNQLGGMFGFFDMQNAMEEASERQISKLYRKIEYLAFIAGVAPMLGLFGTVTGMIRAFNQIALTEGMARPSDLAGGISEALVTTCLGLAVAMPAMFFVAFFRNRIDSIVAEAEVLVERLMGRFRSGADAHGGTHEQ